MHLSRTIRSVTAVALIVAGSLLNGCGKSKNAAKTGPPPPPEVGVVVIQPQRVTLTTELPGRTSACLTAEVRPQVNGIIQKRLFTEGTDVRAGQALYQIDPAPYRATYASARASLSRAGAALVTARLKENRYHELVRINAVSKQEYDDAHAALKQAEADVEAGRASVESARINLAYTRVAAPISGRIGRSTVTNGALVTANQTAALATIQFLGSMYVDVTQSNAELLKLKRNLASGLLKNGSASQARVRLFLEDGSAYPTPGVLKFSEVTVEQSTGSVTLRAIFPNPKQTLLPGMFVRAIVEEGVSEQALLVPQRGVTRNPKGDAIVMVVGSGDRVEQRAVRVVRTVGDNWLVAEGLKGGERVIVEGIQNAKPGAAVKCVPFGAAPKASPAAAPQPATVRK